MTTNLQLVTDYMITNNALTVVPFEVPSPTAIDYKYYLTGTQNKTVGDEASINVLIKRTDNNEHAYATAFIRYLGLGPTNAKYNPSLFVDPPSIGPALLSDHAAPGTKAFGLLPQPGIKYKFQADIPRGGDGYIAATQKINIMETANNGYTFGTNGNFELDGCGLYADAVAVSGGMTAATWTSDDSPHTTLPMAIPSPKPSQTPVPNQFTSISRTDKFGTHFLYKPRGSSTRPSIFVQLGQYDWTWTATASRPNEYSNSWQISNASDSAKAPLFSGDDTYLPSASTVFNLGKDCPPIPTKDM